MTVISRNTNLDLEHPTERHVAKGVFGCGSLSNVWVRYTLYVCILYICI